MVKRNQVSLPKQGYKEVSTTRRVTRKPVGDTRRGRIPSVNEEEIVVKSVDGEVRVSSVTSPREFHESVQSLPHNKVIAICGMGFGAVQLIGCPMLYTNVCQLMVEGMDPVNERVRIHGKDFFLTPGDFTRIMGVNDGGTDVDLEGDMRSDLFLGVVKLLAADNGEITLSSLKKIVCERPVVDGIFKVAYVLFALATLLCPTGSNEVDRSLLIPLMDTTAIGGKNWASYCFDKLLSSVVSFKSNHYRSNIAGSLVFLQLYYFEVVGGNMGWVDRTVTPLLGWGMAEARYLIYWVEQRGGVHDSNANVWAADAQNPLLLGIVGKTGKLNSTNGENVGPDIYAKKEDLEVVQRGVNRLEQTVGVIQPGFAEMTATMERHERLLHNYVNGDAFERIVTDVMQRLREANENVNLQQPSQSTQSPQTRENINPTAPQVGFDGLTATKASEDSSLRVLYSRKPNRNAVPDELHAGKPGVDDIVGAGYLSDASQLSISPAGPPKPAHRSINEKQKKQSTAVSRKSVRALFKARTSKTATYFNHGSAQHNTKKMSIGVPAEPHIEVQPGSAEGDIAILNFVCMEFQSDDIKQRYQNVVLARYAGRHVTHQDLASLGLEKHVWSPVIDIFSAYLNQPNGIDWFLPTYFGENANNYEVSTGYKGWIEQTRSCCGLDEFAARINDCRRIFIPMREPGEVGHWYLLVVHVKDKVAEILDSAPDKVKEYGRLEAARLALNMLDSVFLLDVITKMDNQVLFGSFPYVDPKQIHLQPNGFDCGVFVIRNMQEYGNNWSAKYVSEAERARLIIECIRTPLNSIHGVDHIVNEALSGGMVADSFPNTDS